MNRRGLLATLVAVAVGCQVYGGWTYGKAWLAQELMEGAWARTRALQTPQRPWPWADTSPIARLSVPRLGESVLVLEGSHGRSLAFGPGRVVGTALPGEAGNLVVGGHRDTHFAFLQELQPEDRLRLEDQRGTIEIYRVVNLQVLDASETSVMEDFGDRRLTLVTCYPFEAVIPGGPLRYVVTAVAEDPRRENPSFASVAG